jgi:hypothetical protein
MDTSSCEIQLHVAAYHAEAGYNNDTPGIGALCPINGDWSLAVGTYFNSLRKQSVYAGGAWQPVRLGPMKAGLYGGGVTGYRDVVVPFLALSLSVPIGSAFGVHLVAGPKVYGITPTFAALSFSVKF